MPPGTRRRGQHHHHHGDTPDAEPEEEEIARGGGGSGGGEEGAAVMAAPAAPSPPLQPPPPAIEPRFISKWVSLSAGLLVALCSGLTYLFSLYAPALKAEFGWDQRAVGGIGAAANLGGYLSIPAGLLFDALSGPYPRAGPRITIGVGCLLMAGGWGWLAALAASGPPASYASFACAAALGAFGATFLDTAALALAVANHPSHRGTAVGVTKAGLGLSGSSWAVAWTVAAGAGASARPIPSLLRGLAIFPPLLALLACAGVNRVPFTQADEAAALAEERAARARARAERLGGGAAPSPPSPPRPPRRPRYRRPPAPPAARFATAGHAILAIAAYETAAALALRGGSGGQAPPPPLDPAARGLLLAGLVGLVATLAAVPLGPGGGLWAVRSGSAPARPLDCVVGDDDDEEDEDEEEDGEEEKGRAFSRSPSPSAAAAAAAASSDEGGEAGPSTRLLSTPPPRPPRPSLPPRPMERPPRAYTASQAVRRPAFLALAFICFAGMGSGLTVINNLGAMAASAAAVGGSGGGSGGGGGPPAPGPAPPLPPPSPPPSAVDPSALVALFSVANCVGRLGFGHVSEAALHAWGVPRPAWLAGAGLLGAGAALLASLGGPTAPWALPLASAGAGAAFGGHWACAAAALPELFGAPAFASIYAALQVAPALGSVLLARGLAGAVYDRAAAAQGAGPGGECAGRGCFGPTLLVLAGLQACGACVSGALAFRARAKYRRLGAWLRLREAEEEGRVG